MTQQRRGIVLTFGYLALLSACMRAAPLLTPGDTIGAMTLSNSGYGIRSINEFCNLNLFFTPGDTTAQPGSTTIACYAPVPVGTRLLVGEAWATSTAAQRETNWAAMTWELYIDGHQVNLPAFGTDDFPYGGQVVRRWQVVLDNVTAGEHTRRSVFRVREDIFDGRVSYPAGTYDTTYRFTTPP